MIGAALTLIATLALGTLAAPTTVAAQSGAKLPRVGVLQPGTPASAAHLFEAFKQAMREQGYVEGQHVVFEHRFGEFKPERLSAAAAELVRLKVDVIVTATEWRLPRPSNKPG